MASSYIWDINPFQDFLLASIMYKSDISDKELEADIFVSFSSMLEYIIPDTNEIELLDFEIKKRNSKFTVVAKNIISALWLSGIFPENPNEVIVKNEFILENIKYKFNAKTNKLTYRKIKK